MLLHNSNLRIGVLTVNKKGFGFVDIDGEEDVYIECPVCGERLDEKDWEV